MMRLHECERKLEVVGTRPKEDGKSARYGVQREYTWMDKTTRRRNEHW